MILILKTYCDILYLDEHLNVFEIEKKTGGEYLMGFQETFKALSDGTRREILSLLKYGAKTAGEIGDNFQMTGATISHHLAVLRDAGLISDEKRGKYIYYELNMSVLDEITGWIALLKGGKEDEE